MPWKQPHYAMVSILIVCGGFNTASVSRTWVVDQKHAQATDEGQGTETAPFLTINKAAQLAEPGDTVLVHAGVYRERVAPARGGTATACITYRAVPGDTVYIRGSRVWSGAQWQKDAQHPNLYTATLDQSLFDPSYKPFGIALTGNDHLTLGQIFLDGLPYRETTSSIAGPLRTNPYQFAYRSQNNLVYLHVPPGTQPDDYLIEVTVQEQVFSPNTRGLGYIRIEGFVLEHSANQFPANFWSHASNKQAGLIGCKSGHNWIIENNVIRYAQSIGIDCGNEGAGGGGTSGMGYHLIRNNIIAFCGCTGIMGQYSRATRVIGNIIFGSNYHLESNIPESAGMKFHNMVDGHIEGNLVMDCEVFGIWLDAACKHTRVTRNALINNRGNGVFVEITHGPVLVDNNFIANTRYQHWLPDPEGDGIYSHDASGVTVAHNFCLSDTGFSVLMRTVTNRRVDGAAAQCSNNRLYNNFFVNAAQGTIHLPYPGPLARDNDENANLFSEGKAFVATTYGLTTIDQIRSAFRAACPGDSFIHYVDRENRSGFTFPPSGKPGESGGQQYGAICTPEQWRALMNFGSKSHAHGITDIAFSREEMTLTFTIGDAPWNTDCVVLDSIRQDYWGNEVAAAGRLPGPFQNLQRGVNTFKIWNGPVPQMPPLAGPMPVTIRRGHDTGHRPGTGVARRRGLAVTGLGVVRLERADAFDVRGRRIGQHATGMHPVPLTTPGVIVTGELKRQR